MCFCACLFSNPNILLLVNSLSSWGITYLKDKVSSVVSKNRLLSITVENQCSVKSKVTQRQIALTGESRGDKRSLSVLTKLIKSGDSTWHSQTQKRKNSFVVVSARLLREQTHSPFSIVIKPCLPVSLKWLFHWMFYMAALRSHWSQSRPWDASVELASASQLSQPSAQDPWGTALNALLQAAC